MAGEGILLLLFLTLFVLFAVVLPLWTYSDAQRNSPQSAFLWAVVVFFAPFVGIALYFLLGREV